MRIPLFFAAHASLSVLLQSLFQHRYGAHRMYTMGPRTERALHLLTALVQGSSYLDPRAYALLHREHHAFADTERDPHSPAQHGNPLRMMLATARRYEGLRTGRERTEPRFEGGYPEWPAVDRAFDGWVVRVGFGALTALLYARHATRPWHWALLPVHWVMGPAHGAVVNWAGHAYGYRNFRTRDGSRNALPVDLLTMGELFQNNHHARPARANFAARRFEVDPTWQVMRVLARLRLIRLAPGARAAPDAPAEAATLPVAPLLERRVAAAAP